MTVAVRERIADCTACRGNGFVVRGACAVARCHVCKGRGFFYIAKMGVHSRVACEHGPRGGEKKTKAAVLACVLALLGGCAGILSGKPCLSRSRVAAESAAYQAAGEERWERLEALEAADAAVEQVRALGEADEVAAVAAHPEEGAREGQAAWRLGELQNSLESLVRP